MKALLVLEDGTTFPGTGFGAVGEAAGEVVFNTSMTGYQEILTDPSYGGQIVVMTYPEIGNYGVNDEDVESRKPFLRGFVANEYWPVPSNWRAGDSLGSYLEGSGIVGIHGIDTRRLTKLIRSSGAMKGIISTADLDSGSLLAKVRLSENIVGADLVTEVSTERAYGWTAGTGRWRPAGGGRGNDAEAGEGGEEGLFTVVVYDLGVKYNILRRLVDSGCGVTVVPSTTPPSDVLVLEPDGIVLSNGPGDPAAVSYAIENTRVLLGKKPILGICMGHQILSLAMGAKTFKLKFGHRGANQPVMNLDTGRVEITSQNHGFAVDPDTVPTDVEITHINLNDRTVEGVRHKGLPAFSIQYHPEASPGPHDSSYLFGRFIDLMRDARGK